MTKLTLSALFISLLFLTSCATYLIRTGFYNLPTGISKADFLKGYESKTPNCIGSKPASSRKFSINGDSWDVLIYNVYDETSVNCGYPRVDHHEYVAFKNDKLEEYGQGNLPLILQNSQRQYNINTNTNE